MKKALAIILSTMLALPAMADRKMDIQKLESVSSELATLKSDLKNAQDSRRGAIIQASVSAAAAAFLLTTGVRKMNNPQGGDIGAGIDMGIGLLVAGAGVGAGAYGAVQGYRIYVKSEQITNLINAIGSKQLELDAAKRVLETIE
jgi:hypothetical protein